MAHEEYIRIVPGSRLAFLMVHGIMGTPECFKNLLPLIPEDCSIYNIRLDGHCSSLKDFSNTSMKKWKAQVASYLDAIFAQNQKVIFVGYSLGALFAVDTAVRFPDRVVHLFCHGLPIVMRKPPGAKINIWRIAFHKVKPNTPTARMAAACATQHTRKLWKYVPILPRLWELFQEMRRTKKLLPQLRVPCRSYQGAHDEMLSRRNNTFLSQFPTITNTVLPHSGHFRFAPEDEPLVLADFQKVIDMHR